MISLALTLVAAWVALLITLATRRPRGTGLAESLRLLPDLLRLIRNLAADRALPRTIRIRLAPLLAYLASPIDIVPDFIPVLGYADDAIITAVVLRSIIRRTGIQVVRSHWPGTQPDSQPSPD